MFFLHSSEKLFQSKNMIRLFLLGFKNGFHGFGVLMSEMIVAFFLMLIYCFGVGITALLHMIRHNRLLKFSHDDHRDSYWIDLPETERKIERYYKQF